MIAIVVGGGPAGLMAAEQMATSGAIVTVHEHMPSVARKLLLAGRSGLNLTHAEPLPQLLARYGDAPQVVAAVRAFDPAALRAWSAELGETTFVGSSGRVFPTAMRATPLLRAWLTRLNDLGVTIELRSRWLGWSATPAGDLRPTTLRFEHTDSSTSEDTADAVVFALGGASWPRVGSDGTWVQTFRDAGVDVLALRPANCGIRVAWSPRFGQRFAGVPLKNIALGVDGTWVRGDATITADGLESGPVYAQSAAIRDTIEAQGSCPVAVDLHPDLSAAEVRARWARRRPKDSLANSLRRALGLAPAAVALLREATGNDVPTEPAALAALVKAVPLVVPAVMPLARAISSAGGIALAEIDEQFMLRRLPGVFVAGEMLDWEAPTGGYLLQASFSTAVAAARGAISWGARR
ncbi:MAG: TIGR03862 family flavoprotein [Actinomycetota bacterium]|nr:TIGR03862 family flavoprotein [Actinomycetota bacterium]